MSNQDEEIEAAFADLDARVQASQGARVPDEEALREALDEAVRFWPVTADRDFLARPGTGGRLRGVLLIPAKGLLRRLMRWYIEPALADQRRFNAAVLRLLQELARERRRPSESHGPDGGA